MKIYDISQEVFSCEVYPGDPIPEKTALKSMQEGEVYNLILNKLLDNQELFFCFKMGMAFS